MVYSTGINKNNKHILFVQNTKYIVHVQYIVLLYAYLVKNIANYIEISHSNIFVILNLL